ncbi:MAG: ATP-binding cassette domain-containing protein [Hyphomicrobiales bacterium]|nr:ATP-binding cassette domain-containing protein [Hyphomicrobiales bacterium]
MRRAGGCRVTEPALNVAIAAKSYAAPGKSQRLVLRDLRFTVQPGERVAVVGPSGCGKTTLMRLIAGLDRTFEGRVTRPGAGGRLAMVFQEPALLPWRTVEDNIALVHPALDAGALGRLYDALGLAGHRRQFPGQLSLGLARRVALMRAFAVNPGLLLLDEPFVSLDEAMATRLRAELAGILAAGGVTTLLVTHDLDEAVELCSRVLLLSGQPATLAEDVALQHGAMSRAGLREDLIRRIARLGHAT